jgi:hypothetical protein
MWRREGTVDEVRWMLRSSWFDRLTTNGALDPRDVRDSAVYKPSQEPVWQSPTCRESFVLC